MYDSGPHSSLSGCLIRTPEDLLLLLENFDAAVYVVDVETHEILYANQWLRELFGEEVVGRKYWQVFREDQTKPCETCKDNELPGGRLRHSGGVTAQAYDTGRNPCVTMRSRLLELSDGRKVRLEIGLNVEQVNELADDPPSYPAESAPQLKKHKVPPEPESTTLDRRQGRREILEQQSRVELLNGDLMKVNAGLSEVNSALKLLAENIDRPKGASEKRILHGIRYNVLPLLHELRERVEGEGHRASLESLHVYLAGLITGSDDNLYVTEQLTRTEAKIAAMIRSGKSSLEIARKLHVSPNTVKTHRYNIRRKLKINQNYNLRHYLSRTWDSPE